MHRRSIVTAIQLGFGLLAGAPFAARAGAQEALPFFVGERLEYRVRVPKVAMSGSGTMRVDSATDVRGRAALVLRFDLKARLGFVRVVDRTESWLDPLRMSSLRFHKHERHPLSSHDESVEIFPDERRWQGADGGAGSSPGEASLDELSFIYFLRTLSLAEDSVYRFDRHYDAARNPITVRRVGSETLATGAGTFRTIVVEMTVRDPRHYKGEGTIRINLSDDRCRLPVRIESAMPLAGSTILTLEAHSHPPAHFASGGE